MNIVVCGMNGTMGKVLEKELINFENVKLIGYLSPRNGKNGQDIEGNVDVVIDFSHPENVDCVIDYAVKNKCALLECTTGYTEVQKNKLVVAGKSIPVMLSSNTSLGINILRKILKNVSAELNGFDIDIVERHHNKKIDAPSGTAKTLAEDIMVTTGRDHINTLSLRTGTIPGEHVVIFSGVDEILELKHTVFSNKVFAIGALNIAQKLLLKPAGYYNMEDFF